MQASGGGQGGRNAAAGAVGGRVELALVHAGGQVRRRRGGGMQAAQLGLAAGLVATPATALLPSPLAGRGQGQAGDGLRPQDAGAGQGQGLRKGAVPPLNGQLTWGHTQRHVRRISQGHLVDKAASCLERTLG